MKKLFVLLLMVAVILTGCTPSRPDGYSEAAKATKFEEAKREDMSKLQDIEALKKLAVDEAVAVGAKQFDSIVIGDYDNLLDFDYVDVMGKTEDRWLLMRCKCDRRVSEWEVTHIKDALSGNHYKVDVDTTASIPKLYDYATNELVAEQPQRTAEAQERLNQMNERLNDPKNKIESTIETRSREYSLTEIDEVSVNDNASNQGSYIVIIRYKHESDNKDLMKQYSDDIAAYLNEQYDTIDEVAVFWSGSKLSGTCKRSYEKVSGGMKLSDQAGF
ncbi:MAG: hypothetical protein IKH75_10235 [Ruminococcus sp.]|nr:hypothetical protein [Ruminococcus sp.]